MSDTIGFKLNGKEVRPTVNPEHTLLWVLRTELGITGPKYGCGIGVCGSCTVLLDNEPVRSCQIPVSEVEGKHVITIEGMAHEGRLHPIQQAFVEHGAFQCGFCTPGMILTAYGLLLKKPFPTEEEIIEALDDNLCRCGTHPRIVPAVQSAAKKMKELKP